MSEIQLTRRVEADPDKLEHLNGFILVHHVDWHGMFGRPNKDWLRRVDMDRIAANNARYGREEPRDDLEERVLSPRSLAKEFLDHGAVTADTVFKKGFNVDDQVHSSTSLGEALHGGVTVADVNAELARLQRDLPKIVSDVNTSDFMVQDDGSLLEQLVHTQTMSDGEIKRQEAQPKIYAHCPETTAAWSAMMGDALKNIWRRKGLDDDEQNPLAFDHGDTLVLQLSNGHWMTLTASEWCSAGQ